MLLGVGEDTVDELLGLGPRERRPLDGNKVTMDPDHRRGVCRQMEVRGAFLGHDLQEFLER